MKTVIRILMGLVLIVSGAAAVWAIEAEHEHAMADQMIQDGVEGHADIKATDPNSSLTGTVHFIQKNGGLQVDAEVSNVPNPGEHGFHIHEKGSCDDQGKAAGGHYNPMNSQHGFLPEDGLEKSHAGDMGSIEIDEQGHGTLSIFLPGISLTGGEYNVDGRSVILHEKADDFSQPTGNAGGRIGCGIIVAMQDQ